MSGSLILEYVWLDGAYPSALRSKIKVIKDDGYVNPSDLPMWNFDGSSTGQAPGNNSECLLQPMRIYEWGFGHYLVLCEVQNNDGTPHTSNTRAKLRDSAHLFDHDQYWWGFEQEYFITQNNQPVGFPNSGFPAPQGPYYCGVGTSQVRGRALVENHLHACLRMGIDITGVNAEVAIGQWEFQCFSTSTLKACDDLWISRYVLHRESEHHYLNIDFTPKPVKGDWNGSGCHTNFSTLQTRTVGGKECFIEILEALEANHNTHILGYGENNNLRLTGNHETQKIDTFSWGVGDRGASVRIPVGVPEDLWCGYLEDRRPAANCDPYVVAKLIVDTISGK